MVTCPSGAYNRCVTMSSKVVPKKYLGVIAEAVGLGGGDSGEKKLVDNDQRVVVVEDIVTDDPQILLGRILRMTSAPGY